MSETVKYILLFLLAAMFVVLTCCKTDSAQDRIITVSIEPQRWLLEQIVGDKIKVKTFISSGGDPENFDPPMSVVKNASKSIAFMKTGHLQWEETLIDRIKENNGKLTIVDTSEGIPIISGTHDHHGQHDSEPDPHIWSSVKNAIKMSDTMLAEVLKIDPVNAEYYRNNHRKLVARLNLLDQRFQSVVDSLPNPEFLVFHPSLSYLARDYDLHQLSLGSENKELSIASLKEKVKNISQNESLIFFCQPDDNQSGLKSLIQSPRLTVVDINPMSYRWDEEMEKILNAFKQNR
ncbi:MAG: zinc ABC transporter substrate-binding protein [Paramuribaculum sp.]|nr:zinc ABC transporter substrate-binding protein [Paramuribaculum sp.]